MTSPRRRRANRSAATSPRVIAYRRVSTQEQADSGAGMDAQHAKLSARIDAEGWADVCWIDDAALSAKDLDRPELDAALVQLEAGEADILLATKLDRVSRSVHDFSGLLKRSQAEGWRLVILDVDSDTTTPAGKMFAHLTATFAEYERELISQRTKDALAAKRAAGVRLGRPSVLPLAVVERIINERIEERGMREIAEGLTADGIPTARGKAVWSTSSVQAVLDGQDAEPLRWHMAREVSRDAGGRPVLGVVHAFDMTAARMACRKPDVDYTVLDGTPWHGPAPDERCPACVQIRR